MMLARQNLDQPAASPEQNASFKKPFDGFAI
jgi:hypothetical protein